MVKTLNFILASGSAQRVALLATLGYQPKKIIKPEISEIPEKAELPKDFAIRMSHTKAKKIAATNQQEHILAVDTVVALGRRILQQPKTRDEAKSMLQMLQGRRHRIYGVISLQLASGKILTRISITRVKMKLLNQEEIENYLDTLEWQGRAGGYAIQGQAGVFIPWLNGSYSNVVGMDLTQLYYLLKGNGLW